MSSGRATQPRVTVIVPCYNDGELVLETLASIGEDEPVEVVLVDDGSPEEGTRQLLTEIEGNGTRVLRHEHNRGVGAARTTGLEATASDYVFPLDSDDLLVPGALARLADLLDADQDATVAYGDYREFGDVDILRAVPPSVDPYRVAYTNEYPPTALFRRRFLEDVGGWEEFRYGRAYYEDWDLWMTVAERGGRGVHAGPGFVTYRQRVHGPRLMEAARKNHTLIYKRLQSTHPGLFGRIAEHRRESDLGTARKLLYPVVYGGRRRLPFEPRVKAALDRLGVWTLRR